MTVVSTRAGPRSFAHSSCRVEMTGTDKYVGFAEAEGPAVTLRVALRVDWRAIAAVREARREHREEIRPRFILAQRQRRLYARRRRPQSPPSQHRCFPRG